MTATYPDSGFDSFRFYIVSLDLSDLSYKEVPTGLDLAMLVALNREKMDDYLNSPLYKKYKNMTLDKDLIIGNIVDDRMFFCDGQVLWWRYNR